MDDFDCENCVFRVSLQCSSWLLRKNFLRWQQRQLLANGVTKREYLCCKEHLVSPRMNQSCCRWFSKKATYFAFLKRWEVPKAGSKPMLFSLRSIHTFKKRMLVMHQTPMFSQGQCAPTLLMIIVWKKQLRTGEAHDPDVPAIEYFQSL